MESSNVKHGTVLQRSSSAERAKPESEQRKEVVTKSVTVIRRYTIAPALAKAQSWLGGEFLMTEPQVRALMVEFVNYAENRMHTNRKASNKRQAVVKAARAASR